MDWCPCLLGWGWPWDMTHLLAGRWSMSVWLPALPPPPPTRSLWGIAQSIAEVPINSGVLYRLVVFLVFQGTAIWYVMRYAKKVKAHPEQSVMYGVPMEFTPPDVSESDGAFTLRQKLCLLLFPGHHRDAAVWHHSAWVVYQ